MNKFLIVLCATLALVAAAPQGKNEEPIAILAYSNEPNPDGSYQWNYETANGIKADETGTLKKATKPEEGDAVEANGSYSYTGDDGVQISVQYSATADGGFQAQGAHLPTPPPVPAAIQRALEYIRSLPPAKN